MSHPWIYRACGSLFLVIFLLGCNAPKENTAIDWRISLAHDSKKPYGSSIAFQSLPQYFPGARIEPLTKWFRYDNINEKMYGSPDSAALLVMLGLDFYISKEEWTHLLNFANEGNEVLLFTSNLDENIRQSFLLEKLNGGLEEYPIMDIDSNLRSEKAVCTWPDTNRKYGYQGRMIRSYFKLMVHSPEDTDKFKKKELDLSEINIPKYYSIDSNADTLGKTLKGPDFIRYKVGSGHITLHAAPLVLSNYFLLQQGNKAYLDSIWHSFPSNISVVYWNEYFKRSNQGSSLMVLMKYPAIRWAMLIAFFALLLYVLFGMKRMQRIVPEIPPLENASVSFVETVGRLYFNKGNHANLAEKMIQHFLEWVRSNYYLNTSQINEIFAQKLAAKSGKPLEEIEQLLLRIHEVRLGTVSVTPEYLYQLHSIIQSFYQQH